MGIPSSYQYMCPMRPSCLKSGAKAAQETGHDRHAVLSLAALRPAHHNAKSEGNGGIRSVNMGKVPRYQLNAGGAFDRPATKIS